MIYRLLLVIVLVVSIQTKSQIILNMPIDNAIDINPTSPDFLWTYTGTCTSDMYLEFRLTPLVTNKFLDIQSAIYVADALSCSSCNLNTTNMSLGTCQIYVWQIRAYKLVTKIVDNNTITEKQYIGYSQIFKFRTNGCPEGEQELNEVHDYYIEPSLQLDNFVYYIDNNSLNFKYEEKYNNDKIKIHISYINTSKTIEISAASAVAFAIHNGINYVSIDFDYIFDEDDFIEEVGAIYTVEVECPKGDKQFFKFKKI